MAPEMLISSLSGPPYAIDMWSLGSIAYFMLTNRIFLGNFVDLCMYGTGNQERPLCTYAEMDVTPSAQDFVSSLLARSPQARLTAGEALSSEWIASYTEYVLF